MPPSPLDVGAGEAGHLQPMTNANRRRWLAGAGATLAAGPAVVRPSGFGWAADRTEARVYDYLFLDLATAPGVPATRAYAAQLSARKAAIAEAGGEVLGLFSPQIGWRAQQAGLLVGWAPDALRRDAVMAELAGLSGVSRSQRDRLNATARPAAGDRPRPGGIYVHRWFVIDAPALPEFVELSTTGWRDFEARFDTNIFGLFTAEQTATDKAAGQIRLLLLTRYRDHGVWQESRNPTTDAMAAFQRRQLITCDTWNDSTLLITP